MDKNDVIALMNASKSHREWNKNREKVKEAYGGKLPDFWTKEIIQSGMMLQKLELFTDGGTLSQQEILALSTEEGTPIYDAMSALMRGQRSSAVAVALTGILAEFALSIAEESPPLETFRQLSMQSARIVMNAGVDPVTGKNISSN